MSEAEEMAERLFVLGAMLPSEHARGMISTFIATARDATSLLRAQAAEIKALRDRAQKTETLVEYWKIRTALARNDALEEAANVADSRSAVCDDACQKIKAGVLYQNTPDALATERSASLEASHIAAEIRAMKEG